MGKDKEKARLTGQERDFFSMVNRAVFANPFSHEREELDRQIAGLFPGVGTQEALKRSIVEIAAQIERLEMQGRADITLYAGQDRVLVHNSFLYDFFHRFLERFDRLIEEQLLAGTAPLPVPFSAEALAFLNRRGFSPSESLRYFEVVYQLRRAFYFIDRNLVGCSPCMRELRRRLWNSVFTCDLNLYNQHLWNRMEDFSTLILGETGAGKGAAAAAIGRSGFIAFDEKKQRFAESFTHTFVELNLSQFSENLIESELFGHKKGAFTGAVEDHEGIFDRCSRYGAIFLDEIGEVAAPVQIKLLRILQERFFSPVGSHDRHRFEGRVIAATNRPLSQLRARGGMRDDFFYRLCADVITMPPLRQRIEQDDRELDILLAFVVERLLGKPSEDVVRMVRAVIDRNLGLHYRWPGNVRELEQCVRRVLLNGRYEGEKAAPEEPDLSKILAEGIACGSLGAMELVAGYCTLTYRRCGTYEGTARQLGLDRRTVKKYVEGWEGKIQKKE